MHGCASRAPRTLGSDMSVHHSFVAYEEKANNLQLDVQHASQRLQTATQHFKNTGAGEKCLSAETLRSTSACLYSRQLAQATTGTHCESAQEQNNDLLIVLSPYCLCEHQTQTQL